MTERNPEDHEPNDNPNLDPSPDGDQDLEDGGGVKRGHTPPDSQSASATPRHTPDPRPPRSNVMLILIGVIVVFLVFSSSLKALVCGTNAEQHWTLCN